MDLPSLHNAHDLEDAAYRVRVAQRLLRWQMRRLRRVLDHHATFSNERMSMPVILRMSSYTPSATFEPERMRDK